MKIGAWKISTVVGGASLLAILALGVANLSHARIPTIDEFSKLVEEAKKAPAVPDPAAAPRLTDEQEFYLAQLNAELAVIESQLAQKEARTAQRVHRGAEVVAFQDYFKVAAEKARLVAILSPTLEVERAIETKVVKREEIAMKPDGLVMPVVDHVVLSHSPLPPESRPSECDEAAGSNLPDMKPLD